MPGDCKRTLMVTPARGDKNFISTPGRHESGSGDQAPVNAPD